MPIHNHAGGGGGDDGDRSGWGEGGALRAEERFVQLHHQMDSGLFEANDVPRAIALFSATEEWLQPLHSQAEADRLGALADQGELLACELGRQLHNFCTPACTEWPVCPHASAVLSPYLADWLMHGGHADSELHPARVAGATGPLTAVAME